MMHRINLISVVAVFWIGIMIAVVLADARSQPVAAMAAANPPAQTVTPAPVPAPPDPGQPQTPAGEVEPATQLDPNDPNLVIAPYTSYTVTQGPHGFSYGQAAIDLTAGKGAEIHAPITGAVTRLFMDELGNPTLVIDNDRFQVTLMHGDYTVREGDTLTAGDVVGYESNQGNTVDWWGQSCRGRDCGYHSHLNIYDKQAGQNVNPLLLISPGN